MTQAAGKLNHRIRLESLETSQDANGETVETWTHEGDVWANVSPVSGKEFISSAANQSQIVARITVRYRADIQPTWRILFRERYYNIEAVLADIVSGLEYLTVPVSMGAQIYQEEPPVQGFDPATLFANGEQGMYYDASDLSTMFQDADGLLPVTTSGQVVGRFMDNSGRDNNATQATTASKPIFTQLSGNRSLTFDGSNDFLLTGSVNFSQTDTMTVVASVYKASDAAIGVVAELSTSEAANNGTFVLFSPLSTASAYSYRSRGTVDVPATTLNVFPAPRHDVLLGNSDISADLIDLFVSGVRSGTNAADQGTGNYGNFPFYLGRRAGTTFPFNGRLYRFLVVNRLLTAEEKVGVSEWAKSTTPMLPTVRLEGDSYMVGSGGVVLWSTFGILAERLIHCTAVGGSTIADAKDRIVDPANAYLLPFVTAIWDGSHNGFVSYAQYISDIEQAVNALGHNRFVLIPPAVPYNTSPTIAQGIAGAMQARWPDNFLDWRDYIANTNGVINLDRMLNYPTDTIHLNQTAISEMTVGLNNFIDAKGW